MSVTYQHDRFQLTGKRPKQQRRQAPQQQQSTPSTPHILTSPKSLGEKNHPPMRYLDECIPLVSPVDIPSTTTATFAWRSLTTGTIFPLVFISKSYSLFFCTPSACHKSDKKRVCNRALVCALNRTYITCRIKSYNTTLEAGDASTRNAALWSFLSQQQR